MAKRAFIDLDSNNKLHVLNAESNESGAESWLD